MRKIKILNIHASSSGAPGYIEVSDDFTKIFQGKFYNNQLTEEQLPSYTTPEPTGFTLVNATTFDIVENTKYAGRYTVYSPVSSNDSILKPSSSFAAAKTTIRINETIGALNVEDLPAWSSDGYLTNLSTYLFYTGGVEIVVAPAVNITKYPIEFMGRDSSGWGEAFTQNFVNLARTFANSDAPANPFTGQQWYDTDDNKVRVFNGSSWVLVASSYGVIFSSVEPANPFTGQLWYNTTDNIVRVFNGSSWVLVNEAPSYGATFRHTQGSASTTWVVNHLLGLSAPYIGFCQFFVDRGAGPKLIIPADVVFDNANRLTVTFSNPEIGYVMVRP